MAESGHRALGLAVWQQAGQLTDVSAPPNNQRLPCVYVGIRVYHVRVLADSNRLRELA